jgi:hypothetical protein
MFYEANSNEARLFGLSEKTTERDAKVVTDYASDFNGKENTSFLLEEYIKEGTSVTSSTNYCY